MIKKEYIRRTIWSIIIVINIIFWYNLYTDVQLKAQRLVYQVNEVLIKDKRINKERQKYVYSDNNITLLNIIAGKKISYIYAKEYKNIKPFKRFMCKNGESMMEYSRSDENIYDIENAILLYQISINIPLIAILKTYMNEKQYMTLNTSINDLPLPLNVSYMKYEHNCGVYSDWLVKI